MMARGVSSRCRPLVQRDVSFRLHFVYHLIDVGAAAASEHWVHKVDPRFVIAASALETVDAFGRAVTLADGVGVAAAAGSDAALGSGNFGKVRTYEYHGALVAVKELKAGADEESMGAYPVSTFAVWDRRDERA